MKRFGALLIFAILPLPSLGQDSARQSFENLRPLLFQIKTAAEEEAEKTSYGTGFVVRKDGWLITNFHVVADAVWKPKKNRIFAVVDGQNVPAQVLSVDIVNDLALIKIEKSFTKVIAIAPHAPSVGEAIHSLGLPEDLNWTVVNGVYNGIVEQGPFRLIHMASAINHGMSGGPTVNTRQELVGVNVSGQIFAQAISFSVPAEFVRRLIDRVEDRKAAQTAPLKDMNEDVGILEERLSKLLMKGLAESKKIGPWRLPKFPGSVRCWGSEGEDHDEKTYGRRTEFCQVEHHLFIDGERFFGTLRLSVNSFERKKLNATSWRRLRNDAWETLQLDQRSPFDKDSAINFGRTLCEESIVRVGTDDRRLRVCNQRISPFHDLFEAEIAIEILRKDESSLIMLVTASGFRKQSILKAVDALMKRNYDAVKPAEEGARAAN